MTIIVGIKTQHQKEDAVVLASDRLHVRGSGIWRLLESIQKGGEDIGAIVEAIKEKIGDKLPCFLERKIEVSNDRRCAIGTTGDLTQFTAIKINMFADPVRFLADDVVLMQILFPFPIPDEYVEGVLNYYKTNFDIERILMSFESAEVRRISDLQAVSCPYKCEHEKSLLRNRDYNPAISIHLVARRMHGQGDTPFLFEVGAKGEIILSPYSAVGSGRKSALEVLREKFGTCYDPILGRDKSPEEDVTLNDAIELAREAVIAVNKNDLYCHGFDYVVVTPRGIEEHFSDETGRVNIPIHAIIEERLGEIKLERKTLDKIREKCFSDSHGNSKDTKEEVA